MGQSDITLEVAESIDAEFFKLRHAYNALTLYEFFIEILKIRDANIELDLNIENQEYEALKSSVIKQLKESQPSNLSSEQRVKEAFYLGQICSTLTHGNLSLPAALRSFGKVDLNEQELS